MQWNCRKHGLALWRGRLRRNKECTRKKIQDSNPRPVSWCLLYIYYSPAAFHPSWLSLQLMLLSMDIFFSTYEWQLCFCPNFHCLIFLSLWFCCPGCTKELSGISSCSWCSSCGLSSIVYVAFVIIVLSVLWVSWIWPILYPISNCVVEGIHLNWGVEVSSECGCFQCPVTVVTVLWQTLIDSPCQCWTGFVLFSLSHGSVVNFGKVFLNWNIYFIPYCNDYLSYRSGPCSRSVWQEHDSAILFILLSIIHLLTKFLANHIYLSWNLHLLPRSERWSNLWCIFIS